MLFLLLLLSSPFQN